jgi:hypothetical protein
VEEADVTAKLDSRLADLICRSFNSFVKWDVLKFFREHSDQAESVKQMAAFCGREESVVERAADDLARSGFLIRQRIGDLTVYRLSDRPERQEEISLFLAAGDDRVLCVSVIAAVLRAEESPPLDPADRPYPSPAAYG